MATYKVIQDVEAEDKLVGPLTLRQFIYALIAAACLYLCYFVASKGAVFLLPVFLIPALGAGFFAFPWGKDQSTEIWALARIRFLFYPRKRIWNQSGAKDLVTVTAPKRPEQVYTDGLSQTEVRSRLNALATTIDSRGWALKDQVLLGGASMVQSDRLVAAASAPREVPTIGAEVYEDVLDAHDGVAQKFDAMLSQNAAAARHNLEVALQNPAPEAPSVVTEGQQNDYWFLNQTGAAQPDPGAAVFQDAVVHPGDASVLPAAPEDAQTQALEAIVNDPSHHFGGLQATSPKHGHLPVIQPLSEQSAAPQTAAAPTISVPEPVIIDAPDPAPAAPTPPVVAKAAPVVAAPKSAPPASPAKAPEAPVTPAPNADILNLSRNNDRSIDSLAREAKQTDETEVTISLH